MDKKKKLIYVEKGLLMYEEEVGLTSVPMLKIVGEKGIRRGTSFGKIRSLYKKFSKRLVNLGGRFSSLFEMRIYDDVEIIDFY
jgi:hypothetical protein